MNQRSLAASLSYEAVYAQWDAITEDFPASDEAKMEARQFAGALHEEIFTTFQDTSDPEDRENLVVLHYFRLRSQWTAFNTQIGYQLASGRQDPGLFLRAALLSVLVTPLEANLPEGVQDTVDQILYHPAEFPALLTGTNDSALPADADTTGNLGATPNREADLLREVRELKTQLAENHPQPPRPLTDPERQLSRLSAEREMLAREVGSDDIVETILILRQMKDRIAAQESEIYWLRYEQDQLRELFGDLQQSEILMEIRRQSERRTELEGEIRELRSERELLALEVGCGNPNDLLRAVRAVRETARSLSAQVAQFIVDRDTLQRTIGRSAPSEVARYIRQLHDELDTLTRRLSERRPYAGEAPPAQDSTQSALEQALALLK
ncbi:MAG: hypothetical protein OHK0029_28920 [Armatimonadaceae bacterium]